MYVNLKSIEIIRNHNFVRFYTTFMFMKVSTVSHSQLNIKNYLNEPFGSVFTDHMLVANYINGQWQEAEIVPFSKIPMSPSLSAINYGQSIFEGMKAFRNEKNEIRLFRPYENYNRINKSAIRMCMPTIPENIFIDGLKQLLLMDKDWIPTVEGSALYIRPVLFATDEAIGVKPSDSYKFCIVCCQIASYFKEPLKVIIEDQYIRAAEGGVGFAKTAGNYGGAMYPTKLIQEKGYNQIIWTDAREHKYLEESGAMNLMLVINNTVITPSLSDSKLSGVTRNSILQLAKHMEYAVEERLVSVDELTIAFNNGSLTELFGVGTAASVAPIKLFAYKNKDYELPLIDDSSFQRKAGKLLNAIKTGSEADVFKWNVVF